MGEFEIDLQTGELLSDGRRTMLSEKPLQLLVALVERPREMLTRQELRQRLWGADTLVDSDLSLNKAMNRLREALQDSAEEPRYVETLPRRGYRLIAPVDQLISGAKDPRTQPGQVQASNKAITREFLIVLVGTLLGAVSVLILAVAARNERTAVSTPRITQLTTSSSEAPVRTGAISPDGKRLVFSDISGLHIRSLETGATKTVPTPADFRERRVDWQVVGWFPNGARFLANIAPFEEACLHCEHFSAWAIPADGGMPQKLRDDANTESISPDGSKIAFTADLETPGGREVWVMGADGEHARRLFRTAPDEWVRFVKWSPDGRRLTYEHQGAGWVLLENRPLNGGVPVVVLPASEISTLGDYVWSSKGRIIYRLEEGDAEARNCNFWSVEIDSLTGRAASRPKRITNWAGFGLSWISITNDGRRLAFVESAHHSNINIVTLNAGIRGTCARKLTLTESWDYPVGWTPDGRTVVFASNRDGSWGIYKQRLTDDVPLSIVTGLRYMPIHTAVTADGNWILYVATEPERTDSNHSRKLVRVPLSGGAPETITTDRDVLDVHCPQSPASSCVIASPGTDGKELVFSSLDNLHAHSSELMRFAQPTIEQSWQWQLSPDGSRAALFEPTQARIWVLTFSTAITKEIRLKKLRSLYNLTWAAGGKSFLVSDPVSQGSALFQVDLDGNASLLREEKGSMAMMGIPSPAGRNLAVMNWKVSSNMWMLRDF